MRTSDTLPRSSGQLLRCSWPGDPTWFGIPNTERRATSLQSSSFSMVTGCALVCLFPSVAYALYFRQGPVREPRGGISDRPEVRQASGDRLEALYVLAVHTGLRQGELLGLKWDDIDLEAGTLQVRRTLTAAKGGPRLAAPKTKGSRRRVSLTEVAAQALKGYLERQLAEIDRAGSLWQENGLVFASETGAPLDRRDITSRRFKLLLEGAGLPHFRFHDLRHTCATLPLCC